MTSIAYLLNGGEGVQANDLRWKSAGVSMRRLDYWTTVGYLRVIGEVNPGSGCNRLWPVEETVIAARMVRLIDGSSRVRSGRAGARRVGWRGRPRGVGVVTTRYGIRPHDGDHRHGTLNGYSNLKCRCHACRRAWAEYVDGRRHDRAARGLPLDDPRHGKSSTYFNYRCRCDLCRAAHVAYKRVYRVGASA